MVTSRAYAGVPAADRAAARRDRLIEASLDLLATEGYQGITVVGLCKQAKLNERYFYESFTGRAEVLLAALDQVAAALALSIVQAVGEAANDPRSRATAAIRTAVYETTDDPRKAALLLESTSNPALQEVRLNLSNSFIDLLLDQAVAALEVDRTPEVETWGKFAATALFAAVLETESAWLRGQLDISRDQLIEFTVEMFMATAHHMPVKTRTAAR